MSNRIYDIITVGGGLGGAAIAKAMAECGARVLVLEREKQFHDRVRSEGMAPWGSAEVAQLGLNDALKAARANQGRFACGLGPKRDLVATTPQSLPNFHFYHPAMQEAVLEAAARSGAQIVRGASVTIGRTRLSREGRVRCRRQSVGGAGAFGDRCRREDIERQEVGKLHLQT